MSHAWISRGRVQSRLVRLAGIDRLRHRVVPLENQALRDELSVELLVIAANDGEGVHDVVNFASFQTVCMKESRVEFRPDQQSALFVPTERRPAPFQLSSKGNEIA